MELKRVKVINIVTCCRCLSIYEVSTRFEQYNIIWPDSVILKENVGRNRPIGLDQTCFKNSSKFHAKMHTLTHCILYRRNKVIPQDHLSVQFVPVNLASWPHYSIEKIQKELKNRRNLSVLAKVIYSTTFIFMRSFIKIIDQRTKPSCPSLA